MLWLSVLSVLVAGCGSTGGSGTGGSATASSPTTAQHVAAGARLHWSACKGGAGPAGYQCATLQVPLDYADPAKGTIGLALDRRPATGHAIGSLVENPGGPGVSGVDYLPDLVAELPPSITSRFNVVGFDPRGVARSAPVTCGTPSQLTAELSVDPAPTTSAGFARLVAADRSFAAGCEARSGRVLPFVSTANAARDLDRIRAALGDSRLTYIGFSYGTYLGAVYAKMFPTHIRAMVLDGALDPALGPVASIDAQAASLDAELGAFLRTCASGSCGWSTGPRPLAAFESLLARVRAHPIAVSGTGQSVGPAALLYGTAAALYSPASWPTLGAALSSLAAGHGRTILALFDGYFERQPNGSYANVVEAETAVDCLDAPAPTLATLRADAAAVSKVAPVFGLLDLYSEASCSVWPVPATGQVGPVKAAGSPPIVVVGSTGDPVTPYAWAVALAHQLSHGVLLTRTGYGHTGYAFSSCIRSAVDTYLLTLRPPKAGTVCGSG